MPDYQYLLRLWSFPPAVTFGCELLAIVYLRGWWLLRRAGVPFVPAWRAVAFLSGLLTMWIALASPIDALNAIVLTAHMLQHMLLMMVAPPLILLGAPLVPLGCGLSNLGLRRAARVSTWPFANRVGHALTNPVAGALVLGLVMFAWHTPALYELALRSELCHEIEHASFFFASLMFWWPIVLPWPSRAQWPRWAMVPYLLLADLQNTALSAILAFSDRVLYPSYSKAPQLFPLSPLEDQVAAGAFMWVVGSLAFILPAIVLAVQCLSTGSTRDPLPVV
jgi:cytochrome c oxidase assembly factor CtaG